MENALHMIVETDKASRRKVEEAYARREKLSEELTAKKQEIDAQNEEQAKKVLAQKREDAAKKLESAKTERAEKDERIRAQLNQIYESKHEVWETEIFNAVVGEGEQA